MRTKRVAPVCALVLALVAALLGALPARAASEGTGTVEVRLSDAKAASVLANVHVTLLGADTVQRSSDAAGTVRFEDVTPGVYVVHARRESYADAASPRFDVRAGEVTRVALELTPSLATIGRTQARPRVAISSVDDTVAVRRVSETLLDALQNLSGVALQLDGSSISLRGHDPSQTGFSIDGLNIAGGIPGAAFNAGLFTGASVDFDPSARASAGAVNLTTLNATKSWAESLELAYGSYDRSSYKLAVTGTSGRLGIAVQHGGRATAMPLTGQVFADSSGLDYAHNGTIGGSGDVLKLTYALSDKTTLRLSGLHAQQTTNEVCTDATTILPCGYGPGIVRDNNFNYAALGATSLLGATTLNANVYTNINDEHFDGRSMFVAGAPQPYVTYRTGYYKGANLQASTTAGRHTLSAVLSEYHGGNVFTQQFDGHEYPSSVDVRGIQAALSDRYRASDRVSLTVSLSSANATGTGHALVGSLKGDVRLSAHDTLSLSASTGVSAPNLSAARAYSDPHKAEIDCNGRSALVQGPAESPVAQRSSSVQLGLRHTWARGDISVSAYRNDAFGTTFYGALQLAQAAKVVPLPSGYVDALQQTWSSPSVCGAIPFDISRVLAYETLTDVQQRYVGASTEGKLLLGKSSAAFWSYGVTSAFLPSVDPSLTSLGFIFPTNRQIPGRPLQTGSLTLSLISPRAHTELIGNVRFTGADNQQNLPAYTVVNLGIVTALKHGTLSLLEANAFGTEAGVFTTYRGINPFTLADRSTIAFPSTPLPPRQVTLKYSVKIAK
ncbi:MAG TPA: TonB-dependent receptor [Dongiaceae bacterium]|nr:TonB-dependent receptor [Dongiaceae bacterium]